MRPKFMFAFLSSGLFYDNEVLKVNRGHTGKDFKSLARAHILSDCNLDWVSPAVVAFACHWEYDCNGAQCNTCPSL